jgi:hypothetical protein
MDEARQKREESRKQMGLKKTQDPRYIQRAGRLKDLSAPFFLSTAIEYDIDKKISANCVLGLKSNMYSDPVWAKSVSVVSFW